MTKHTPPVPATTRLVPVKHAFVQYVATKNAHPPHGSSGALHPAVFTRNGMRPS